MKKAIPVILLMIVLIGIALFLRYGGDILTSRFHIGQFDYGLPQDNSQTIPGAVVFDGIQSALQNFNLRTNDWVMLPDLVWQPSQPLAKTNGTGIVLIFTNRINGKGLYAHVQPGSDSNFLNFDLYYAK